MTKTKQQNNELVDVIDALIENISDSKSKKVSVGVILKNLESRSYGPVIFVLALLAMSPLGAIPGVPATIATLLLLFSVQLLFGKKHPWVPQALKKISFSLDKTKKAAESLRKPLRFVEGFTSHRMSALTGEYANYAIAIPVSLLAVIMVPLELIPFAVFFPAFFVALFGIALTTRDGVLILLNYGLLLAALLTTLFLFW